MATCIRQLASGVSDSQAWRPKQLNDIQGLQPFRVNLVHNLWLKVLWYQVHSEHLMCKRDIYIRPIVDLTLCAWRLGAALHLTHMSWYLISVRKCCRFRPKPLVSALWRFTLRGMFFVEKQSLWRWRCLQKRYYLLNKRMAVHIRHCRLWYCAFTVGVWGQAEQRRNGKDQHIHLQTDRSSSSKCWGEQDTQREAPLVPLLQRKATFVSVFTLNCHSFRS